jgi:hypothetical protein
LANSIPARIEVQSSIVYEYLQKTGLDPSINVRFRHSFNGGHYRRGRLDVVKDAIGRSEERPLQATGYGTGCAGASEARVLDNIDPLAKLAAKR